MVQIVGWHDILLVHGGWRFDCTKRSLYLYVCLYQYILKQNWKTATVCSYTFTPTLADSGYPDTGKLTPMQVARSENTTCKIEIVNLMSGI
jgi:hypothetical protein